MKVRSLNSSECTLPARTALAGKVGMSRELTRLTSPLAPSGRLKLTARVENRNLWKIQCQAQDLFT